jgi:hypothetical protein
MISRLVLRSLIAAGGEARHAPQNAAEIVAIQRLSQPIESRQCADLGAVRVSEPQGGGGRCAIAEPRMPGDVPDQLHIHRWHPVLQQRSLLQQERRDRASKLEAVAVIGQSAEPASQIGRDVSGVEKGEYAKCTSFGKSPVERCSPL